MFVYLINKYAQGVMDMLCIPKVSVNIPKYNNVPNDRVSGNRENSCIGLKPVYRYNLASDTVSFKGNTKVDTNNPQDTEAVKDFIRGYSKRKSSPVPWGDYAIDKIAENVTPKNREFLEDILTINDNALGSKTVIDLLQYVDKPETDKELFRKKIERFKNLSQTLQGDDFSPSTLVSHLGEMSSNTIKDLLESSVLLPKSIQKNKLNSLSTSYNYVAEEYIPKQIKKKNAERSLKHLPKMSDEEKENFVASVMKGNDTQPSFAHVLMLRSIFDEPVCNELLDNRNKYIKTIYIPRLKILTDGDKDTLIKICDKGVTEKHDKGGELKQYSISIDDKIHSLNMLAANRKIINAGYEGINYSDYLLPMNDVFGDYGRLKVDMQGIKIDLMDKSLRSLGIDKKVVDKYMKEYNKAYKEDQSLKTCRDKFWDINYSHLINHDQNANDPSPLPSILQDIIVAGTTGKMDEFLFEKGPIAETNKRVAKIFEQEGINYKKWLKPSIKPISKEFTSKYAKPDEPKKTFTVSVWDRNPQKSLFDGNYTTCCTGIDKDQGLSFPYFLANTSTTTLEVRTEKDKVIAMSRILMAKVDGKPSMIVENIEVNNKMAKHYLYDDKTKYKFREMIFDYARKFVKDVNNTDKEMPVYFSGMYFKVRDIEKGLGNSKRYDDVELIGDYPNDIYINAYGSRMNMDRLSFADDGDGFGMTLIDITKKAEPVIDKNSATDSDSNYNYDDTAYYNQRNRIH